MSSKEAFGTPDSARVVGLRFAFILGSVGFVTSFGAHVVNVNLPVYAQQVGFGVALIGVLVAVYDLAELVAKPIFGAVADRQGLKRTMLGAIALFTAASLMYLIVPPRLLLLVRFLQGVGAAGLSAISLALVGTYFVKNRGRAFGIYNAIKGAGYVVSPAVGGLVVARASFAWIFIVTAGIGAAAFLVSLALPAVDSHEGERGLEDDDDFSPRAFLAVFRSPVLAPWYLVTVVNMFFVGILFAFLPVYVHSLGYTPTKTGALLSGVAVAYLLVQPLAGFLADKVDPAMTVRVGLFAAAAATGATPFLTGLPLVAVSLVAAAGTGVVWTNTDSVISRLASKGKIGAIMARPGRSRSWET